MIEIAEFLQFAFVQRAIIAGILLALVGALLGCFVVLRKMSFFTDAIAHASLTGVALALLFSYNATLGAIVFSVAIGALLTRMDQRKVLSSDTVIGVLFTSSIALAIILIRFIPSVSIDINSLLFGDILTVTSVELWLSVLLLVATVLFIKHYYRPMLKKIFNHDLAKVEHENLLRMDYFFLALLSLTIAVSLKMIGAILVSALVIIPAATAQNVSKNIKYLFIHSVIFAILSVLVGLYASFVLNTPSGATIVVVQAIIFLLSFVFKRT